MNTRIRYVIVILLVGVGCMFLFVACGSTPVCRKWPEFTPPKRASRISNRVLARVSAPDADCPAPAQARNGRWTVSRVFPTAPGERLPPSMRDLCAYDWQAPDGVPPDIGALPRSRLRSMGFDAPVVVGLAPASGTMKGRMCDRQEQLFQQVAGIENFPAPLNANPAAPQLVRVGFPDSSSRPHGSMPADTITLGSNPHGFNIAWITRSLTCSRSDSKICGGKGPSGSCLIETRMERALDRRLPADQPLADDGYQSGAHTMRSQFAKAIRRMVQDWQQENPQRRFILNIAAGWEPDCALPAPSPSPQTGSSAGAAAAASASPGRGIADGTEKLGRSPDEEPSDISYPTSSCDGISELSDGSKAVFAALAEAACRGALIIAAAGNDLGYNPPHQGPMFPAGWETIALDQNAHCDAFSISPGPSNNAYRPLVHAVGGVNGDDVPIVSSRQGGRPRLAAPASLAVGFPNTAGQAGYGKDSPTVSSFVHAPCSNSYLLTGSSIAAAVASAAAAAVWVYRPDLPAQTVMDVVYQSGKNLGIPANFWQENQGQPTIHRIAICQAVKFACGVDAPAGDTSTCPTKTLALLPCHPPAVDAGAIAAWQPPEPVSGAVPAPPSYFDVAHGQPGRPNCPTCALIQVGEEVGRWDVTGDVDVQSLNGGTLSRPLLQVYGVNGNSLATSEDFTQSTWSQTTPTAVALNHSIEASGVATATITWTLSVGGTSSTVTQEIYIQP